MNENDGGSMVVSARTLTRPEIADYVERVRLYLGDLDYEVRDDLTGELEADLTELVLERGTTALPDPREYADDMRAAAGLPERGSVPHLSRDGSGADSEFASWLRRARQWGGRWLASSWRRSVCEFVTVLQPLWWVARAWVVVQWVDVMFFGYPHQWWPSIAGPVVGGLILLGVTVTSVQLGRHRWPPAPQGRRAGATARLGVVALDLLVLAAVPVVVSSIDLSTNGEADYARHVADAVAAAPTAVRIDGLRVCNLFPYDSEGRPLVGVQLLDQRGHPLNLRCGANGRSAVPWLLGDVPRPNVFPQYERGETEPPTPIRKRLPAVRPGTDSVRSP